jgi:hypothetical protein
LNSHYSYQWQLSFYFRGPFPPLVDGISNQSIGFQRVAILLGELGVLVQVLIKGCHAPEFKQPVGSDRAGFCVSAQASPMVATDC